MKLLIRQRMFSWTDCYDVCDERGFPRYEVRTELLSLGHRIHVYDKATGKEVGTVYEKLLTLLPRFEISMGGRVCGTVCKELTLLRPKYRVDYLGWSVDGDLMGWDYHVTKGRQALMSIRKELLKWTDTYVLEYGDPANELPGLLLVLAIDAVNCSNDK